MKKRLVKIIWIAAIPILAVFAYLFIVRAIIGMVATGSPEYVYRSFFWGDSDIFDFEKFPYREVGTAAPAYHFQSNIRDDLFTNQGDFDQLIKAGGTTALIIIKDDVILYEKYFNSFERDSWFTSFSIAKSFDSALIGIAIQEGAIGSVNDRVIQYIPELKNRGLDDLTIRNLLKMDCGVRYRDTGIWDILGMQNDDGKTYYIPDLRSLALTIRPSKEAIGTCFHYNNYYPILEGMILERTTGMSVSQYLQEKIWKPLGMEYPATWSVNKDPGGLEKMESGINARAIDYAKFGRLYLNKGNWNGTQIVPETWVVESTSLVQNDHRPQVGATSLPEGGYYGYHWWGTDRGNGQYDYTAVGHLGQYIFIRPDQNLIVVRLGDESGTPVNWFQMMQEIALNASN